MACPDGSLGVHQDLTEPLNAVREVLPLQILQPTEGKGCLVFPPEKCRRIRKIEVVIDVFRLAMPGDMVLVRDGLNRRKPRWGHRRSNSAANFLMSSSAFCLGDVPSMD